MSLPFGFFDIYTLLNDVVKLRKEFVMGILAFCVMLIVSIYTGIIAALVFSIIFFIIGISLWYVIPIAVLAIISIMLVYLYIYKKSK